MNPLVVCKNISLTLDGKELLKDINFILENDNLVIFGPNGAGKTLLLTILSGNLEPTKGDVDILNKSLYDNKSHEIKKQIGFVSPKLFEDYDFNSNVTDIVMSGLFGSIGVASDPAKNNNKIVREYINRVIKEKHRDTNIALELLEKVGVKYLSNKSFGLLSYGEKVRVLIARSLINNPSLFILDEPTTGLDLQMRAEFTKVVKDLSEISKIIYVTHYLEEVLPNFKKILFLKKGEVFKFGNKKEILTSKNLSNLLEIEVFLQEKDERYFAWI